MRKLFISLAIVLIGLAAQAETITVSNSKVRMSFTADGSQWAMTEFVANGQNLLPQKGSTTPLWKITYLGPQGETPSFIPRFTAYKGGVLSEDGRSATFTWSVVIEREDIWPITVTVSLPSDDAELPEWNIQAQMPKKWLITELEFPRISVLRPEDVKGIMSVGFGAEYPIPVSNDMIQSTYPSCTGALQLIMAHNPQGTLYLSSLDPMGSAKFFQIKGEGEMLTFVQKVETSYAWTDKGHFSLPWPTVMGYNPESWDKTVVKWYRPFALSCEWGAKSIAERDIAPWILDADVWIRPQDVTEAQMGYVRRSIDTFGDGLGIHWYYWHNHPFDSYYPEYFPAKPGFKEYVAEAQSKGAHVTPYTNGRLWDTATDSYKKLKGKKASCLKSDGTLYTEIYSSRVINTVTCPSSPIWQKVQTDISRRILGELGTDGVYIDQIGAAAAMPCYADNHGHPKGAGCWWPQSYRHMLTSMKESVYKPGQAVTTEENAECYIDLFDMMLVVNGPHTPTVHMIPLFPLVYSDVCVYSGITYVPWKINDGSFNFMQAKSLLWGSQLGWINPELLFRNGNETEVAFLKTLGAFRKANHDIFVGGRFMGEFVPEGEANVEIDVPGYQRTAVVLGANWKTVDGKDVIILVNMNKWSRLVTLPDGREVTVPGYNAVRL